MSRVSCDKRVERERERERERVVRPAVLYGLEMVVLTKRQVAELEVAEQKMLRFSLRLTRMDRIRKKHIRGIAGADVLETKL